MSCVMNSKTEKRWKDKDYKQKTSKERKYNNICKIQPMDIYRMFGFPLERPQTMDWTKACHW